MIVSNNGLIAITDDGVIYNFENFDFIQKFKELNAYGNSFSLKKDFGEVIITCNGSQLLDFGEVHENTQFKN